MIAEFFGVDEDLDTIMKISVQEKPLGSLGDAIEDNKCENIMQRIAEVECTVKKAAIQLLLYFSPTKTSLKMATPKKR